MIGLRGLNAENCRCNDINESIVLSEILKESHVLSRVQFFVSRIYPDLAAIKMMDCRDLEAVPKLLQYADADADRLWERVLSIHLFTTAQNGPQKD